MEKDLKHQIDTDVAAQSALPQTGQNNQFSYKLGKYIHDHRHQINGNAGWFAFNQVGRSYISIIPHMALFISSYHLFNRADRSLTKAIESRFGAGATKNAETMLKVSEKAPLLRYSHMLVNSPLKPIVMIGTGFTAYRVVSKMLKKMWNEMFDPNNTEQDTINYVQNFGSNLKEAAVDVFPAESQSGAYAAIALGGIRANYKPPAAFNHGHAYSGTPFEPGYLKDSKITNRWSMKRLKDMFVNPRSKFLPDAMITIAAYWVYFEFADRLYKDIQIKRGRWPGAPNSLSKQPPKDDELEQSWSGVLADPSQETAKFHAEEEEAGTDKLPKKYGFWTDDPSIGRLFLKRMVPVTLGIGSYVVTNRLGHMMVGRLKTPAESLGLPFISKDFWHNFKTVGSAMGTFWAYNTINDTWDQNYDKFFDRLEEKHREKMGIKPKEEKHDQPQPKIECKDAECKDEHKSRPPVSAEHSIS